MSRGLLVAAWTALGVAVAGALLAPKYFCSVGEGMPAAEVLLIAGLLAGTVLLFAAIITESVRETSFREAVISSMIFVATIAAGIGVLLLWQHQTSTWWQCG
jgi:hypothetical protein